jgi:hypothetical protein
MSRSINIVFILIPLTVIIGAIIIAFIHLPAIFVNVMVDIVSGIAGFVLGYLYNNKVK